MIEFKIDNIKNELRKIKNNEYEMTTLFFMLLALAVSSEALAQEVFSALYWFYTVAFILAFAKGVYYFYKKIGPIPQLKELGDDLEVKFLFDKRGDLILEEEDYYFYYGKLDGVHIYADRKLKNKDKLMNVIVEYILKEKIKGLTFLKKEVNE